MRVDSFRFLPRSFQPLYADPQPLDGESEVVFSPFEKRLADATIALLTSAGLYVQGQQEPFDADRERRDPTWGDPSWRPIPRGTSQGELGMTHLHVNPADVIADHEVALPIRTLDTMVAEGSVGRSALRHVSVMGYQEVGLHTWRGTTAPEIIEMLRGDGVDGVVLAPV